MCIRDREYAVSNGLFHGTGETTFSPEQSMTRGMFVTVLGRKSNVEQSLYTDCLLYTSSALSKALAREFPAAPVMAAAFAAPGLSFPLSCFSMFQTGLSVLYFV